MNNLRAHPLPLPRGTWALPLRADGRGAELSSAVLAHLWGGKKRTIPTVRVARTLLEARLQYTLPL